MDYVEDFDIKNNSSLLLENGKYVWDDDDFSFHYLTDYKILVMDGRSSMWFVSNELNQEEIYSILKQKNKT